MKKFGGGGATGAAQGSRVFGDGGSNGAIYDSNKSKMAAAAMLKKFQMAISPQRLTIYLYSAHRAVIFAIAQLSFKYIFGRRMHIHFLHVYSLADVIYLVNITKKIYRIYCDRI